ncbi:MAG: hypothetical protein L0Y70_02780 [Gemmataceae bacterium]|nr:hypothetical protein [Gemmataceae bacterium]
MSKIMRDYVLFTLAFVLAVGFWGSVIFVCRRKWRQAWSLESARLNALAQQRANRSREEFLEFFRNRKVPDSIANHVFSFFQESVAVHVRNFSVLPGDEIEAVYHVDIEDVELEVEKWAKHWNLKLPTPDGTQKQCIVKTVEDLLLFLAACPSRAGSAHRKK